MKKWQIQNSDSETSEISEISEILFRVFLFPSFRFCAIAKIKNSDLKISEKNFRIFRLFDLAQLTVMYHVSMACFHPEAATGVFCQKKVFLEISQFSQENTCARVSFLINLQA